MKTLKNLLLSAVMLAAAVSAQAEWVNGYTRSNGTYVNGYYRTPANNTPYDNLSYRGYPSQQPGYVSPRSYSPVTMPYYGDSSYSTLPYTVSGTSRSYGNTTYHRFSDSYGGSLTGTTRCYGNTAYTTLNGW